VDKNGVTPCRAGKLPLQLAAMNMSNINAQILTLEAARTRKREAVYHAAMMDPHTAAELPLDDIWKMVDELIEAHGSWLPQFQ
jgi:alpha-galactosidase